MKVDLYNLENKAVGKIELPEKVFGVPWKPALVSQVITAQRANERRPWAHAKTRAEVSGGGRKPWRQKGTGRARHGSIRSPLWRGGGKAHGPQKERDYSQKINKKMSRLALVSALSKKFKDGEVKIFDHLEVAKPKTNLLFGYLKPLLAPKKSAKKLDLLMIRDRESKNLTRAGRNLQKTKVVTTEALNTLDVLNYKHVFIDKRAIPDIAKRYSTTYTP